MDNTLELANIAEQIDKLDNDLPLTDDYENILTSNTPMIDLRAPGEFAEGAFPTAINLPLMSDEERHQIGLCYKQQGQQAAIALGAKLVSGKNREQKLQTWKAFIRQNPDSYIYCFRGGMRSAITQQWLAEEGLTLRRIKGGYKAMRRFLIDALQKLSQSENFIILSGFTGIGKTHFIHEYPKHLDLEGLSNHKGSSFGYDIEPQPSVINFENSLTIDLLKKKALPGACLVEDEGKRIGRLAVPLALYQKLQQSPIIVLQESMEYRVNTIYNDYMHGIQKKAISKWGEQQGTEFVIHYFMNSLERIKKRLGGTRYKSMSADLKWALEHKDEAKLRLWIERLMKEYYDPMYLYQLSQKKERVVFEGNREEVHSFLKDKIHHGARL